MIVSFACRHTKELFEVQKSGKFGVDVMKIALRKLLILNAASCLEDLRVLPGNRLEALKGERKGQYSIRVNIQWRLCFVFLNGNATEVEIVDYH